MCTYVRTNVPFKGCLTGSRHIAVIVVAGDSVTIEREEKKRFIIHKEG